MWNAGCRLRVTTSRVGQRITQVLYASAPRLRDITSCRCYTCSSKSLSWKYTMGQKNSLFHAFGYNSAENEPICMKSGTVWAKFWELALADFGRDPQSSDSLRGSRNVFCPVNNARFRRFPVRKILRRFNTTSIGEAVKTFETGEKFSIRGRLKNAKKLLTKFSGLATSGHHISAMITDRRAIHKHWQSSLQPSLQRRCHIRCNRDHSIANDVMQQTGSFSMPGRCKQYSKNNFWAQAMRPKGWWNCTSWRSLISTIASLLLWGGLPVQLPACCSLGAYMSAPAH